MSSKLINLANNKFKEMHSATNMQALYILGFQEAFN